MWEQLKRIDIEVAKQKLEAFRRMTLSRHEEELKDLDAAITENDARYLAGETGGHTATCACIQQDISGLCSTTDGCLEWRRGLSNGPQTLVSR